MSNVVSSHSRNWLAYLVDALVHSGVMPTWEAVDYLTTNLIGEPPNLNLHHTKSPYEAIQQFLLRLYGPIVEAASRTVTLPPRAMIHMFTDISLMGKSAVLVVYFPGGNLPHHLLLLDSAPAWDLMFPDIEHFNRWAQERYMWITDALASVQRLQGLNDPCTEPQPHEQLAQQSSFQPVGGA
ncbi:MAG: hypothetical protein D6690_10660 [Nitrospirae bacterium]|nr:MAG: hypothetical protein D6690_10660 [Nitrospirota bacterium]